MKVKAEVPDSPRDQRSAKYGPWAKSDLLFVKVCWNTVLLFGGGGEYIVLAVFVL